jgi:sporulation protein YlmC with PRC-barrel domain
MIRATELDGRAVVDMDAAEKVGKIEKVIIDPDARRVAGFTVSHGSSLISPGTKVTLPASSVHAIGPDAVTVHGSVVVNDLAHLADLPRVSDVVGRKVVSRDGRLLGTVEDVLINDDDGRIVGYALNEQGGMGKLEGLIAGDKHAHPSSYLRADADLRAGKDLIVAPEDAVARDWDADSSERPSPPSNLAGPRGGWEY